MSKAFTKEDDVDLPSLPPYHTPWPAGARNYMTRVGYEKLRREHDALVGRALPALARAAREDDAKRSAWLEAARRAQILGIHLDGAEIVTPPTLPIAHAKLGVRVTVKGEDGRSREVSIVGLDEADATVGRVGWTAPIARALAGARVGDVVTVRSPRGNEDLEVLALAPVDATGSDDPLEPTS